MKNAKLLQLIERMETAIKALPTQTGKGSIFIYNPKRYEPDDPELLKQLQIPDDAEGIVLIPDNGRGDVPGVIGGGEESGQ